MSNHLSELLHVVTGLAPAADRFDSTQTTDYITLRDFDSALAVIQHGTGATGTYTITVQGADNAAGDNPVAIPFKYRRVSATGTSDVPGALTDATSAGVLITAGSDQIYEIDLLATMLDADKPFLAVKTVESVNSPVAGAILFVLGNARYKAATPQTAIA